MLFIARRSWTSLHSCPLGFLSGKRSVTEVNPRDDEALSLINYYGVYVLKGFV